MTDDRTQDNVFRRTVMTEDQQQFASKFKELYQLMADQRHDLNTLSNLLMTDSMKYIYRPTRDELLKRLINRMGEVEDSTMAIIKAARLIKRQRLTDDQQIANLFINVSSMIGVNKLPYDPTFDSRDYMQVSDLTSAVISDDPPNGYEQEPPLNREEDA